MRYLEHLLVPGETVVHRAHRSVIATALRPGLVLFAAVAVAGAGSFVPPLFPFIWALPLVVVPWLIWRYLVWRHKVYVVTNYRVLKVEGVVSKGHTDASLDKINDMQLSQSMLGRIFNYGDLTISTANEASGLTFHFIDKPVEFKRQALTFREAGRHDPGNTSAGNDALGQLERLGALLEKGVVTREEFEAKKAELLKRVQ